MYFNTGDYVVDSKCPGTYLNVTTFQRQAKPSFLIFHKMQSNLKGKLKNKTIYLFIFDTQNVQRKKEKYTTEYSGEETLNRNHKAYNVRLPH